MDQTKQAKLVYGWIRENIEMEYKHMTIPVDIKHLITVWFGPFFGSKILIPTEEIEFIDCLLKHKEIPEMNCKSLNLLYRASENEYKASKFHELCDNKGPTFTFIQTEFGTVMGDYTAMSWKSSNGYIADRTAFLFLIRSNEHNRECPVIYDIRNDGDDHEYAIYDAKDDGPTFGVGSDIFIRDKCNEMHIAEEDESSDEDEPLSYCYDDDGINTYFDYKASVMVGGKAILDSSEYVYQFRVEEYEVFGVQLNCDIGET